MIRALLVAMAMACLVAAAATMAAGPRTRSCGGPGKPPCPLQAWMRKHVAAPLAKGDREGLSASLERVRTLNPEPAGWKHWDRFAGDGARAARAGDAGGTMEACRRCHEVYRTRYNEQHRERPVP